MKKKKLSLKGLEVRSFVTSLDSNEKATIAGGGNTDNPVCHSNVPACVRTIAEVCLIVPFTCGEPQSLCPPPPDNTMLC
jgi:hypothetical protein